MSLTSEKAVVRTLTVISSVTLRSGRRLRDTSGPPAGRSGEQLARGPSRLPATPTEAGELFHQEEADSQSGKPMTGTVALSRKCPHLKICASTVINVGVDASNPNTPLLPNALKLCNRICDV